ncbi:unnamed protein product [Knipowitschia caucasica]|uniref:THD domain-containing protein n=1 Tax=Knipowitschia caucasica TaxID=637954 RepID=A0AAV2MJV9_KNICA
MINTHLTSVAPPPLPPRQHQSVAPVMVPYDLLPKPHSRGLIRFMFTVVLLNLLLSMFGFFYLYKNGTTQRKQDMKSSFSHAEPSMQKQHSHHVEKRESHTVFARMTVLQPTTPPKPHPGHLKWDMRHSQYSRPHINYYNSSWLTIEKPGYYFVYSRVTFSSGHSTIPLTNRVDWRKTQTGEPKPIMQAFCHTISTLCTASAEDVVQLETGNQLSVWTEDLSLISYEETGTTLGLFSL